jgi:hypothetical protein
VNKALIEEYCQARLMTCCKLILSLNPARNEADELTQALVNNICNAITTVVNKPLQDGTVVATMLHKPLQTHFHRAKVTSDLNV